MNKIFLLILLFLCIGANAFAQKDKKKEKRIEHKVVIQLSTPDTAAYRALTRQLNNLKTAWEEAEVVVVAHNKGINMLQKATCSVPNEIQRLMAKGVVFIACEYTMQQLKLSKGEMLENIAYTPYGLVEIITRQEKGYAYLKAGF
ncbi:MAG: DsrE family protein [Microscillaceae bacterium]|nr:DsrE family protein [Microscillaceae bacterium]MDW8461553.1 DsrE family protein [Cytophagales bacterium]